MFFFLIVFTIIAVIINVQMAKTYDYNVILCGIMGVPFGLFSTLVIWVLGMAKGGNPNPFAYAALNTGEYTPGVSLAKKNKLDFESRLKRLKALLDDGTITKSEFEEKKKQILEDI